MKKTLNFKQPWCDLQLNAQNFCFFTHNTFIKLFYMFRALPAHHQEVHVVIVYLQPLVSSLEAGYIQLRRRLPEDEQVMLKTCRGV